MKIAMFTNTYLPHVGGVARSVKTLEDACRARGHEVRIVAPEFDGAEVTDDVLRVPAIQHFNGSEFSVRLPVPNLIRDFIDEFQPDLIHSHHPFLLGVAALREARKMQIPILFTHHTLYERYTHYMPLDSPALKRVAITLATEYCNLCDLVIAPSESVAHLLRDRQVSTPIEVTPTGIDTKAFAKGRGPRFRKKLGIPRDAKVIGHVGRLALEKNLSFLAEAVGACLDADPSLVFLLVGESESFSEIMKILARHCDTQRVFPAGKQSGGNLADAYAAIQCFAFTSQTETQGLVLAEAMAAGRPVVALDGPGVREIVKDGKNGLLLPGDATVEDFASALRRLTGDASLMKSLKRSAKKSAAHYDISPCVDQMMRNYEIALGGGERHSAKDISAWDRLIGGMEIELELLGADLAAAAAAVIETPATEARL